MCGGVRIQHDPLLDEGAGIKTHQVSGFCPLLPPRAPSVQTLWAGRPLTRATNSTRYSLCSRSFSRHHVHVSANPHNDPGQSITVTHFSEKGTKVRGSLVICPWSHISKRQSQDLNLSDPGSRAYLVTLRSDLPWRERPLITCLGDISFFVHLHLAPPSCAD